MGQAGRELDDLLSARDLAERVREDLAVLGGDDLGQFVLAGVQEFSEPEEDRLTAGQRQVPPSGEGALCSGDGGVGLVLAGGGDSLGLDAKRGVIDGCGPVTGRPVLDAIDPVRDDGEGGLWLGASRKRSGGGHGDLLQLGVGGGGGSPSWTR